MTELYGFGFSRQLGSPANCGFCYASHPAGTPHPEIVLISPPNTTKDETDFSKHESTKR
jgi:hypothetical protein